MKTYIVTVHNPKEGDAGLVTVLAPSGRLYTREVIPQHTDAFGDKQYVINLVKRMFPMVANKVHGEALLFHSAASTRMNGWEYVSVHAVDTDD